MSEQNTYIITNNPLLYAEHDNEIQQQVNTIYDQIKNMSYTPGRITLYEDFGINCGDVINCEGHLFYVMRKTMNKSGVVLECFGNQERNEVSSLNEQVKALRGRTSTLKVDLDGLSHTITDASGTMSQIANTLDGFTVSDGQGRTLIKGSSIDTSTITANSLTIGQVSGLQSALNSASSSGGYSFSDIRGMISDRYDITSVRNGSTYTAQLISPEIYGGTIYATDSADSFYTMIDGDGLQIFNDGSTVEPGDPFVQITLGMNLADIVRPNVSLLLGNTNPVLVSKFWQQTADSDFAYGNHMWLGNEDMTRGICVNFNTGKYKFIGLEETTGAV